MKSKFIEFRASEESINGVNFFYFSLINEEGKEYTLIIRSCEKEFIKASCSCAFGSYYKFSKKNLEDKKECVHVNEAKEILKLMEYIDDEKTRDDDKSEDTVTPIEQQTGQPQ